MQRIPRLVAALAVGISLAGGAQAANAGPASADTFVPIEEPDALPTLIPAHQYSILHRTFAEGTQGCSMRPVQPDEATAWWRQGVGAHPKWTDPNLPLWSPGTVRIVQGPAGDWQLPDGKAVSASSVYVHMCEASHDTSPGVHQITATMGESDTFTTTPPDPMCLDEDNDSYSPCHLAPTDARSGFGWG